MFRIGAAIMGIKCEVSGHSPSRGPALVVANHISWIDIVAIGAHVPCHFIAKSDVATWPVFGPLARVIGTLFVERERRSATASFRGAMRDALAGDAILILFPEGTSSDGSEVLSFKSALFPDPDGSNLVVYPLTLSYVGNGERNHRFYGWYGDMELMPHMWAVLCAGSVRVRLDFGQEIPASTVQNRKELTASCEAIVREKLATARKAAKQTGQTDL